MIGPAGSRWATVYNNANGPSSGKIGPFVAEVTQVSYHSEAEGSAILSLHTPNDHTHQYAFHTHDDTSLRSSL